MSNDPRDFIEAGDRLAVKRTLGEGVNWFGGYSPRNDSLCAEGPWREWVDLAHAILRADADARAAGLTP